MFPLQTLQEFVLDRVAEEEAAADEEHGERTRWECQAKRLIANAHGTGSKMMGGMRISTGCTECSGGSGSVSWPCVTLRAIGLPYQQHPDYRDDWRP